MALPTAGAATSIWGALRVPRRVSGNLSKEIQYAGRGNRSARMSHRAERSVYLEGCGGISVFSTRLCFIFGTGAGPESGHQLLIPHWSVSFPAPLTFSVI